MGAGGAAACASSAVSQIRSTSPDSDRTGIHIRICGRSPNLVTRAERGQASARENSDARATCSGVGVTPV